MGVHHEVGWRTAGLHAQHCHLLLLLLLLLVLLLLLLLLPLVASYRAKILIVLLRCHVLRDTFTVGLPLSQRGAIGTLICTGNPHLLPLCCDILRHACAKSDKKQARRSFAIRCLDEFEANQVVNLLPFAFTSTWQRRGQQ